MISARVENGALIVTDGVRDILRASAEVRLSDGRVRASSEQAGALAWSSKPMHRLA